MIAMIGSRCRTRLGIGSQVVFAFVGRLAPVKDVPGLITAFLAYRAGIRRMQGSLLSVTDKTGKPARISSAHIHLDSA